MKLMKASEAAADANDGADAPDRNFTRIGEMAREYAVTLRTLRFYEDKGLLNPLREGSTRLYTRRDKARLKLILLGRKVGFSLREIRQIIDLYEPSGTNTRQLKVALEKSEKQLGRLQRQRALVDDAIGELDTLMSTVRRLLAERSSDQMRGAR